MARRVALGETYLNTLQRGTKIYGLEKKNDFLYSL